MMYLRDGDIEGLVSMIITVMKQNDNKLPAGLIAECVDGLSKASPSTIATFYRELSAKCPAVLKYF